ncbi:MAG TPA: hypothetical protein VHM92_02425 [Allosphingosinicella sp.]|nr:hypothetical protein [Allosphingosinicella sp.]
MKKILLTFAAVGALAATAPAAAQYSNVNAGGAVGISNQIAQLEQRLDADIRAGRIDPREATSLTAQMRDLRRLERSYSRNGLSAAERATLLNRIRDMRQDIRVAARASGYDQLGSRVDDGVRYDRYGNRDVNGMYDRYGNRIDATATVRYDRYGNRDVNGEYDRYGNRIGVATSVERYDRYGNRDVNGIYDRYGNRIGAAAGVERYDRYGNRDADGDYDRYGNRIGTTTTVRYDRYGNRSATGEYDARGNWVGRADDDDVYRGQGGPYENDDVYCERRGGVGGVLGNVLGNVLGRGDNCGTLRVGARASANLRTLPSEYRYRYPDGNGVYYRTDGRVIYQIDARTDTVIRIYSMDR